MGSSGPRLVHRRVDGVIGDKPEITAQRRKHMKCLGFEPDIELSLVESNARKSINSRFIRDLREMYIRLI